MTKLGTTIKVLDVIDPDYQGRDLPALTIGTAGVCAHCGHKITWRVLCENERGDVFEMGRTCALAEDSVHKLSLRSKEELAEARSLRAVVASPEFVAWASKLPHPKGWANKTLLDDVRYWASKKPAYIKSVVATFRGTVNGETVLSKKDAQRLETVHTTLTRLEAMYAAYEAACQSKAKSIAGIKQAITTGNLSADVIKLLGDGVMDTTVALTSKYEFDAAVVTSNEVLAAEKLAAVLVRSGVQAPKVPSVHNVNATLTNIAAKYGLKYTYHA